jgi:hypothetical protein
MRRQRLPSVTVIVITSLQGRRAWKAGTRFQSDFCSKHFTPPGLGSSQSNSTRGQLGIIPLDKKTLLAQCVRRLIYYASLGFQQFQTQNQRATASTKQTCRISTVYYWKPKWLKENYAVRTAVMSMRSRMESQTFYSQVIWVCANKFLGHFFVVCMY